MMMLWFDVKFFAFPEKIQQFLSYCKKIPVKLYDGL